MNTTGSVTLIPSIPQGSATNERIGRKVTLKSIQMRGYAVSNATTLVTYCRVMIVYDRQPNKALAGITDILDSADSLSFPNSGNSDRFRTLYNKSFAVVGNNTTGGQQTEKSMHVMDWFKNVNLPVQYATGASGAITNITTGSLLLVTCGNVISSTADGDLTVGFRVSFSDP